jgi:2-polyprenyl-3-methyl-5-hydroxy-6-metoxy-1,4-benzoquinol methylase
MNAKGQCMDTVQRNNVYTCHCCGETNAHYVQHYVLRRSLAVAPMYLCRSCESISVDQAAVRRHYPQSNSREAIEFHKRIRARNETWAASLLAQLSARQGGSLADKTVIDIGCGIGTLLSVAAKMSARAIGYEIDQLAVAEARRDPRLEIHDELFTRSSSPMKGGLLCCVSVLEHLHHPLELLDEIAAHALASESAVFLCVPTLPSGWRSFLEASVHAKGNPFFDNEEHISHFTDACLLDVWRKRFRIEPEVVTAGGWRGLYHVPASHARGSVPPAGPMDPRRALS